MSLVSFFCPTCSKQLRLPIPPPGASIRCTECGAVWEPQSSPLVTRANRPPAPPPRSAREANAPTLRKPLPVKDPTTTTPSTPTNPDRVGSSPALLWGLVGGGAFLLALFLLCGGVVLLWSLPSGKPSSSEQAARTEERPRNTTPSSKKADLNPEERPRNTTPSKNADPNQIVVQPVGIRPPDTHSANSTPPTAEATPPGDGSLPREVLERVKSATVYIRVVNADGKKSSGSGFFEETSHKVLTNAHVVGMLKPGAPQPRLVEVVRNSGRPTEVTYTALILAVDQSSDLAVLSVVLPPAEVAALPTLKVTSARDLVETQRVFVFGYPFGEQLNKNVTVSASSVSSLHTYPNGLLKRVQLNGGMHPGNSGGPVVDIHGNVVGIAVSKIEGTQIDFAIPGEHVAPILTGR